MRTNFTEALGRALENGIRLAKHAFFSKERKSTEICARREFFRESFRTSYINAGTMG